MREVAFCGIYYSSLFGRWKEVRGFYSKKRERVGRGRLVDCLCAILELVNTSYVMLCLCDFGLGF